MRAHPAPTLPDPEPLFTLAAVAGRPLCKALGLTAPALRRACQARRLTFHRPGGNIILVAEADIRAWIDGSRVEAQA